MPAAQGHPVTRRQGSRLPRGVLMALALATTVFCIDTQAACPSWPLWQQFKSTYISEDGRVIDRSIAEHITTSEGQAYALLFALAANDRRSFTSVLQWTENNLAQGDLNKTLPAWQWGHDSNDQWRVLDANSASDADVWLAYALSEAGRLWQQPRFTQLAHAVSANILSTEATHLPGLGFTLLPGPTGFVSGNTWRLNASYLPIQALRLLAHDQHDAWRDIIASSLHVITASTEHGYVSDWIEYQSSEGFTAQRATHDTRIGSYNAIRVYLWAGTLSSRDAAYPSLTKSLAPSLTQFDHQAFPAEQVDVTTGQLQGTGSPGFSAAYLPLLKVFGKPALFAPQEQRARAARNEQGYYTDVLRLFGLGWLDGWIAFNTNGRLQVKWSRACSA